MSAIGDVAAYVKLTQIKYRRHFSLSWNIFIVIVVVNLILLFMVVNSGWKLERENRKLLPGKKESSQNAFLPDIRNGITAHAFIHFSQLTIPLTGNVIFYHFTSSVHEENPMKNCPQDFKMQGHRINYIIYCFSLCWLVRKVSLSRPSVQYTNDDEAVATCLSRIPKSYADELMIQSRPVKGEHLFFLQVDLIVNRLRNTWGCSMV